MKWKRNFGFKWEKKKKWGPYLKCLPQLWIEGPLVAPRPCLVFVLGGAWPVPLVANPWWKEQKGNLKRMNVQMEPEKLVDWKEVEMKRGWQCVKWCVWDGTDDDGMLLCGKTPEKGDDDDDEMSEWSWPRWWNVCWTAIDAKKCKPLMVAKCDNWWPGGDNNCVGCS